MIVVQLTSSRFYGSVERQMLGLARALPEEWRTAFVSFAEGGRCREFLQEVITNGFEGLALRRDTPRLLAAVQELTGLLRQQSADVLCCHGYKAGLLGRLAASRVGIPAIAVAHGWTGEDFKVRLYEALDRFGMRFMNRVVCVSEGQAVKVRRAGVPRERTVVIRDAIQAERFDHPDLTYREKLRAFFAQPPERIVGAAGRLSPEKGFDLLVDAAARISAGDRSTGFVLFGDGFLRKTLEQQIVAKGLQDRFILAGYRTDLDRFLPYFDLLALPSYTEGLPNVVLEAFAAGVPVVATAVGGTPELVEDGVNGYLVPPGDSRVLAERIERLLRSETDRRAMGQRGRQRVREDFTFAGQSREYQRLFAQLLASRGRQSPEEREAGAGADLRGLTSPARPARLVPTSDERNGFGGYAR